VKFWLGDGGEFFDPLGDALPCEFSDTGIGTMAPTTKLSVDTNVYDNITPVFQVNNTAPPTGNGWYPLFGGLAPNKTPSSLGGVQITYGVADPT
jgi:hypothetical protein